MSLEQYLRIGRLIYIAVGFILDYQKNLSEIIKVLMLDLLNECSGFPYQYTTYDYSTMFLDVAVLTYLEESLHSS